MEDGGGWHGRFGLAAPLPLVRGQSKLWGEGLLPAPRPVPQQFGTSFEQGRPAGLGLPGWRNQFICSQVLAQLQGDEPAGRW